MADSLAATQRAVDAALFARYAGISIDVQDSGGAPVATPVEVFIEDPATEEQTERAYPSVAITFLGATFDVDRFHTSDDMPENIGPVSADPVPEQITRPAPKPYRLQYSIDTWHRVRAAEDRDLVAEAIFQRTPPRGFVTLTNVDGETVDVWVLWAGGITSLDERQPDVVIYHKTLTVDVLADILDDPALGIEKTVTHVRWGVKCIRLVNGAIAGTVDDVTFEVDSVGETVL